MFVPEPKLIEPLPEESDVLEGDSARLECRLGGGPADEVMWFKDDEPLQEDERITFENEGNLHALNIDAVEPDDEAEYKCQVTNPKGTESSVTELIVEEAMCLPVFKQGLLPVEANEGDAVRFDICVAGNPEPVVEWFKDGAQLEDKGDIVIIDDVDDQNKELFCLLLENCKVSDAGEYRAVAMNEAGKSESACQVVVTRKAVPPEFAEEMEEVCCWQIFVLISTTGLEVRIFPSFLPLIHCRAGKGLTSSKNVPKN